MAGIVVWTGAGDAAGVAVAAGAVDVADRGDCSNSGDLVAAGVLLADVVGTGVADAAGEAAVCATWLLLGGTVPVVNFCALKLLVVSGACLAVIPAA